MDYIRDAVEYLENYDNLKRSLENLKLDIMELNLDLKSGAMKGIKYSDMPKGDSANLPDDVIVNKMYKLKVKKNEYALTRKMLEKMDEVIDKLPELDRNILRSWYIDGLRGDTILTHTGCSERNFYRCKSKALKVFAIQLHGIKAV
ncbi:DUF1492 domain-containing protein [Clostridium oryzae]|uniref:Phage transcriptional regulator, RinA family n=1 Tax=Clostridium oryzae TaxID=1450648 RepID=A0A1V4IFZ1_9CLOT|nr:DUF1492 domain-containing protein [Clostridium oryzae]OPJ58447.1 hypothetical protein CLORY_35970 [Clostridium oryzae]